MTIKELRLSLTKPNWASSMNPEQAILCLNTPYNIIEYSRKDMIKVFDELEHKIDIIKMGIEKPTASDGFLLLVLMAMAGDENFNIKK